MKEVTSVIMTYTLEKGMIAAYDRYRHIYLLLFVTLFDVPRGPVFPKKDLCACVSLSLFITTT